MFNSEMNNAINAVDLLNDFIGDFITGTMLLAEYHAKYNSGEIIEEMMIGINKMCFSHLILGLSKWLEFYKKFHNIIPTDLKNDAKNIKKIIENRNVIEFRNKCVGHIWDKDTNRPLLNSEILARIDVITNKDIPTFLRWINNPNPAFSSSSVAGISEKIRDEIVTKYSINPNDIIQR